MTDVAILLVDDEKIVLDSLREQLHANFGDRFLYEAAENAEEAWDVLDELEGDGTRVVVVVSDWLMPGMRGDAFLAAVRERHPRTLRILLTGQADQQAIERSKHLAQVHRVMTKPWRAEELAQVIDLGLTA